MINQEAINILHGIRADNLNLDNTYTKDKYEALGMAIEALENQKTGHWIDDNDGYGTSCSECGKWYTHPYLAKEEIIYCCRCGAKMKGE